MGAYMFVVTSGGSLGLLLGGALVQSVDWHWIFYVNVPIGIGRARARRPADREPPGTGLPRRHRRRRLDPGDAAMMVAVYAIVTAADHGWALRAHARLRRRGRDPRWPRSLVSSRGSRTRSSPCASCAIRTLIGASVVRGFLVTGMFGDLGAGLAVRRARARLRRLGHRPGVPAHDADRRRALARHDGARDGAPRPGADACSAGLSIVVVAAARCLSGVGDHASYFPDAVRARSR